MSEDYLPFKETLPSLHLLQILCARVCVAAGQVAEGNIQCVQACVFVCKRETKRQQFEAVTMKRKMERLDNERMRQTRR